MNLIRFAALVAAVAVPVLLTGCGVHSRSLEPGGSRNSQAGRSYIEQVTAPKYGMEAQTARRLSNRPDVVQRARERVHESFHHHHHR